MLRHLLQRFLLTLPALSLVLTLVFSMIHRPTALPEVCIRMIGDTR